MKQAKQIECGCCEGVEILTPLPTASRPGLNALTYRVGTHAAFLETMKARLSSSDYPALAGLTTREFDDFSIALLDAWATVADVLTFYQERVANEGYLRTATERRSVLELARLVGYQPRLGVASSVFLAYTLEDKFKDEVIISKGAKSQSVPGPGELPQSFETSEDLKARAKWNNLRPRMTRPQSATTIQSGSPNSLVQGPRVYLKGITTNLKPNDPLLISFGTDTLEFYRVKGVTADATADRTLVTLQMAISVAEGWAINVAPDHLSVVEENPEVRLIKDLTRPPSRQLASSLRLTRKLGDQFKEKGEAGYRTLSTFAPVLRDTLATAAANAIPASHCNIRVYAFKIKAGLFGRNIPRRTTIPVNGGVIGDGGDWPIIERITTESMVSHEEETKVYLDAPYDTIQPGSWMIIETQETDRLTDKKTFIVKVESVDATQNRSKYGASGPTTMIEIDFLDEPDKRWIQLKENGNLKPESNIMTGDDFHVLRSTTVYAQPEELEPAEEPIELAVCGGTDDPLELDGFYEGLESGRWVIVSGERDIPDTSGVRFSELAMLASVTQNVSMELADADSGGKKIARKGEKLHTFIKLANELAYCFKRDTVTIYGNVAKATNGETRQEVLGSGDGSKALQSFELKQPPLTYVSASNPTGVDSTLKLFVNDIKWRESDSLAGLSPTDRSFITKTDDEGKTTVVFGNGREGARLPTGVENIKAEYRNGIGKGGNVKAGQITLPSTRPLGVKGVVNPLRASGGADKETRDQARKSAPLAVKALDRLVSVQDYEDFARVYAGVGKARAVEISDGRRQVVHITIAGADDIPIDENSDLYQNLRQALLDLGDPYQAIELEIRELMLIVISARIRILPEYQWEPVVTQVRATLLDAFSFERRELGRDVLLSEVISVMQAVRGVAYVDVDLLRGIPEKILDTERPGERRLLTPDEIAAQVTEPLVYESGKTIQEPISRITVNLADYEEGIIHPAQLAFLTPDVPATLILNQIT